jgi:hypothetical protein
VSEQLRLTEYQQKLYDDWVQYARYLKLGEKTTTCFLKLNNGFELVGTSACVNPEEYVDSIGRHYALVDAVSQLDAFAGFYRQIQK